MVAPYYLAAASTLLIGLSSAAPKRLINYKEWLRSTGQISNITTSLHHTGLLPRDPLVPEHWPNQEDVDFPIPPWPRSCKRDAERAFWSYRDICVRDQAFKRSECFNKPPSEDRCCFNDESAVLSAGNCLGSPFWPLTAQSAAICTYNCDALVAHTCDYGDEPEINNPKHICECMVEGCLLPQQPHCDGADDLNEVRKRSNELDVERKALESERMKLDAEREDLNQARRKMEEDHANDGNKFHLLVTHKMEGELLYMGTIEAPAATPSFDHGKF